ncbi:MAG: UDP-N-acetylmuramoyl-L-alanyl-D-glutamate--2,6-diaminopimelate ligase, partial [Desulfovibrio sp.]|nr:UDP-N-acetylmuramoyl-L-alanyl-D-glutamate--2,6-diaminopimelate ligase [Desulfovibrio sp.]
ALVNVLQALRAAGFKKIIAVFGCGGNRDRGKRPLMGEAVASYADCAVLTSDNPRNEDPMAIIEDVLPGLKHARDVHVEPNRREATRLALSLAKDKDDCVLIAGKGHENYQIIQGVRHHYSDQEVVRELLCA